MTKAARRENHFKEIMILPEITLKSSDMDDLAVPIKLDSSNPKILRNIVAIPFISGMAMFYGMPLMDGSLDAIQASDILYLCSTTIPMGISGVILSVMQRDKYTLQQDFGNRANRQAMKKINHIRKNLPEGTSQYVPAREIFGETALEIAATEKGMTVGLLIQRHNISIEWRPVLNSGRDWDKALDAVSDIYNLVLVQPLHFDVKSLKMRNNRCVYAA